MKIPCEIIDDLLPLYEDAVCSQTTKEAVQAHLKECPRCRSHLTGNTLAKLEPMLADAEQEAAAAKKSFQKIKRRWIISIAVVLVVALALSFGTQLVIRGLLPRDYEANLALSEQFIHALCDGEFYEAATLIPYPYESEQWLEYHRQELVDALEACWQQDIRFLSYDGFDGYSMTGYSIGSSDSQYFYGRTQYVQPYIFRVTIQTGSGETVPGTLYLAFRHGELFRIRLDCALTPETQMLEDALVHTELTN